MGGSQGGVREGGMQGVKGRSSRMRRKDGKLREVGRG